MWLDTLECISWPDQSLSDVILDAPNLIAHYLRAAAGPVVIQESVCQHVCGQVQATFYTECSF